MPPSIKAVFRVAVAMLVFPVICAAQQPDAAKRYPWDQRQKKCFADPKEFPDTLLDPGCRPPQWKNFEETAANFGSLLGPNVDFDLIERASEELGFSRQKFSTGEYLFEPLYRTLDRSMNAGARNAPALAQRFVDEWSRAKGDDGYARLTRALLQFNQAWQARGGGYANTVAPEGWKVFRSKLEQANATLDSASPRLKQTGPWHALKLNVVFAHPELERQRVEAVQAATAAWPDYLAVYSIPMNYMHPRWGGSYELMEGVAQMALQKTRAEYGAAIYALVYERQFRADCDCTLADAKVDWPTMKQGMRDVQARYTVTPARLKHFAGMACQMRDRDEAKHFYAQYDKLKRPDADDQPDPCRLFASR